MSHCHPESENRLDGAQHYSIQCKSLQLSITITKHIFYLCKRVQPCSPFKYIFTPPPPSIYFLFSWLVG